MERLFPWLLIVIGAAVFANGLRGPFIYDDAESIVDNPQVRQLWPPGAALWAPADTPTAGRPIPAVTLSLNYALGGLDPFGYRLVNVAVHLANACLLFVLLRRLLRGPRLGERFGEAAGGLAFATALLWMVHPLVTESVDYVTQRTGTIMAFFYLGTLYAAVRTHDGESKAWSIVAIACCAMGMASKESMVTAPLVVILTDLTLWSRPATAVVRARWKLYAGLAATWLVLAALNIGGPRSATVGFGGELDGFTYLLNQCVVLVDYLRLVVWPHPLVLDYGYPRPLALGDVWPQFAALVALGAVTIVALFRRPAIGFVLACFFIILAPTSSIVPIVTEVGAERRMYLPLAGFVALAVVGGRALVVRGGPRWLGPALAVAVGVALAWGTVRRNADYRSELSIWETAVAAAPDNCRAHTNFANALDRAGRPEEALAHHERSQALRADIICLPIERARGHYNIGRLLQIKGDIDGAIAAYEQAVALAPHPRAHHNLGTVLHGQGRTDEAIAHLRRATEIDPGAADSFSNLGFALLQRGDVADAVGPLRRALELGPEVPRVHFNLAGALRTLGDPDRAVPHYLAAGRLAPDDADMQALVGAALDDVGRYAEAIAHLNRALALTPDQPIVFERLGGALVRSGRVDEGIEWLRRTIERWPQRPYAWAEATRVLAAHPDLRKRNPPEAVRLGEQVVAMTGGRDANALSALATAYAAAGRGGDAAETAARGLEVAEGGSDPVMRERLRAQVEAYGTGGGGGGGGGGA